MKNANYIINYSTFFGMAKLDERKLVEGYCTNTLG